MKPIALAVALTLGSVSANAADLLQLYQQATDTDPQIRAALASREATREVKPLAKSALLPQVSISGELNFTDREITQFATASPEFSESFYSNSLSLTVLQTLYRRDRFVALDQADDQISQADADFRTAEQGLILRVAQAYFDVLSAKDTLVFAQAEKKSIERQLDQAQERFDVGLVAITDVHEAQARYDQARANEIVALNAVDTALEALREIVANAAGELDELKDEIPLVGPEPSSIDFWADTAMQKNPSILSAQFQTEIAKKNIDLEYSGYYPTLDLVGDLTRSRSESEIGTDVDSATIGLQLSIPLDASGRVNSSTRQARFQYEAATEVLDQQRRAVSRQVRDAYRGIQSSISRVKALAATKLSANSALEATQAGFDAGTRTLVDVLNSQSDLFAARRDYAQSRYDYVLNTLSLLDAAGTLNEQDVVTVNAWLK